MNDLIEVLSTYNLSSVLILFVLFISSIYGIYETIKKIKDIFDDYYNKKKNISDRENKINERLTTLEKLVNENKENICTINDTTERIEALEKEVRQIKDIINHIKTDIEDISNDLTKMHEIQNKTNVATTKTEMYRLANEIIIKKWQTQSEYDNLLDLSNIYLMSGGSNFVVPSIVQRALDVKVLTDEEIECRNK